MSSDTILNIDPTVSAALADGQPVVALESTIISHGMPWPDNLETARQVERIVHENGATPATIAVMGGQIRIGLDEASLEALAKSDSVMKLSRADLAFAVSQKRTGATTVAATMMAAQMAGIEVFATGGIGGVHKGAEDSFDISADLSELASTNVIVVCAGAKAILDVEKTLEVLETNGVPVIAVGQDELPAFWSSKSPITAPLRMDHVDDIADFWRVRKQLKQSGGALIANPAPFADEIPAGEMAIYIDQANQEAKDERISGKEVTPFLLSRIARITDGRSLATNIALIKDNAKLAAQIACELAKSD